jgi:hypothetical protein
MGSGDMKVSRSRRRRSGVIEELERQEIENPSKLKVRREGGRIFVDGEIDIDPLVIGRLAGADQAGCASSVWRALQ